MSNGWIDLLLQDGSCGTQTRCLSQNSIEVLLFADIVRFDGFAANDLIDLFLSLQVGVGILEQLHDCEGEHSRGCFVAGNEEN